MSNCVVSGVWLFNSELTSNFDGYGNTFWTSDTDTVEIAFTSNGAAYTRFEQGYYLSSPAKRLLYANSDSEVRVYGDESGYFWENEAYRTVDFGATTQEVSEEFYTWFTANATPIPIIEVTIPRKVDRYSYVVGFNLGLAGMAYPYSAPTPVAYLYNGVRLPALPEWDRGVYPYAMVGYYAYAGTYWLYVLSEPAHDSVLGIPNTANGGAGMCFVCENDKWELAESWGTEGPDSPIVKEVWVNYDYLASDGVTVKLAASTPVPVYE